MTDNEMRMAIAEACGWDWDEHSAWSPSGSRYDRNRSPLACEENGISLLPDYLNDLNAMHEAEKVLDCMSMDEQSKYLDYLYCTVGWGDANNAADGKFKCHYGSVRATARQRAEAFLRTIGKWKEAAQ